MEGHFAFDVLRKVTLLMVHLLGPEIEKVFIFNGRGDIAISKSLHHTKLTSLWYWYKNQSR